MFDIETFKPRIAELCRRVKASRLDIFGSAAGESFGDQSDVHVLVRFESDGEGLFDRYFDPKEGLEEIFGRPVDLVIEEALRNPYFKSSIEHSRTNVYAAWNQEVSVRYRSGRHRYSGVHAQPGAHAG